VAAKDKQIVQKALARMSDHVSRAVNELKSMYMRNKVEAYHIFRTFQVGTKGTPQFPKGVVFEGVSESPLFLRGPSAALDMLVPTLDRFLQITQRFPENDLKQLLLEYRDYMPRGHVEFIDRVEKESSAAGILEFCLDDSKLLLEYLKVVDGVRRFRQTHWNFVTDYVVKREKQAIGSGGSNAVFFIPNQLLAVLDFSLELCAKAERCSFRDE